METLAGKVGIVTGASSGIGEATAVALASKEAKVVLVARRLERLKALKDRIENLGGEAIVIEADITKRFAVEAMAMSTVETFGRIDILVNNAGILSASMIKDLRVEEWERNIDVNLKGMLYGIAAVLPVMIKQGSGHIINISSVAARNVLPGGVIYSTTKSAIETFSEGFRQELSPSTGIRITVIRPGTVDTEARQGITDEEIKRSLSEWRFEFLRPEQIAAAILYAIAQPPEVSVNEVLIRPTRQPR
jgi:NADP-dependent 3-hydroxy acid dehydrogenase YdfG